MFRLLSFAAACLAGSEAIKLTSQTKNDGEFITQADGTAQIRWDIDLSQNQIRERIIEDLGVSAEQFDSYVSRNGYDFLDSPDWTWDYLVEDGDEPEIAYTINGRNLRASAEEIEVLSAGITTTVDFYQRLLAVEEIMKKLKAFETALDALTEGSAEWRAALQYDLTYFLDLLASAMGSVQAAVDSGVATSDKVWNILDMEDIQAVLEIYKELQDYADAHPEELAGESAEDQAEEA